MRIRVRTLRRLIREAVAPSSRWIVRGPKSFKWKHLTPPIIVSAKNKNDAALYALRYWSSRAKGGKLRKDLTQIDPYTVDVRPVPPRGSIPPDAIKRLKRLANARGKRFDPHFIPIEDDFEYAHKIYGKHKWDLSDEEAEDVEAQAGKPAVVDDVVYFHTVYIPLDDPVYPDNLKGKYMYDPMIDQNDGIPPFKGAEDELQYLTPEEVDEMIKRAEEGTTQGDLDAANAGKEDKNQ